MTSIWPLYGSEQGKHFLSMESREWEDNLADSLSLLDEWLADPVNQHDAIASIEDVLRRKHHDYGEDNLLEFGELGILVRCTDKLARLKNLLTKPAEIADETKFDTWRDLAGYALQAMIMIQHEWGEEDTKNTEKVDIFEMRKNRLIRGHCPDCGEGVILRESLWVNRFRCSAGCGFETEDLTDIARNWHFETLMSYLASKRALVVQK